MSVPGAHSAMLYGLKVPSAPSPYFSFSPAASQLQALEFHRSQLCDYRQLLGLRQYQALHASGLGPYAYLDPYTQYLYKAGDPRARFVQEEPKPNHSYIGLIAMAILSSKEKKLVLSDIYQWILDHYPYFRTRGPGWRNSIRHNLSLNDCFIKSGRSANGKGHYWAVHPANVDDFTRGDFRRRRAQRKVRKHMGLSVPDDDDDSPSPSPNPWMQPCAGGQDPLKELSEDCDNNNVAPEGGSNAGDLDGRTGGEVEARNGEGMLAGSHVADFLRLHHQQQQQQQQGVMAGSGHVSKKRLFDVESLLAPDLPRTVLPRVPLLDPTVSSHRVLPPNFLGSSSLNLQHHSMFRQHQSSLHNSDVESMTSEPAHVSDESDIDIEGEDGEDDISVSDKDKSQSDASRQIRLAGDQSLSATRDDEKEDEETQRSSSAEDDRDVLDIKVETVSAEPFPEHHSFHSPRGVSTFPSSVASQATATTRAFSETSPSALDLSSSSSSTTTSPLTSLPMTVFPVLSGGSTQTLMIPRAMDSVAAQRARWMGLHAGLGLGPVVGMASLAAGGAGGGGGGIISSGSDLGALRRYSAFHAAAGAASSISSSNNPMAHGLRGGGGPPIAVPTLAPFFHPVFTAAARYPSLMALGVPGSASAVHAAAAAAAAAASVGSPQVNGTSSGAELSLTSTSRSRGDLADASQSAGDQRL